MLLFYCCKCEQLLDHYTKFSLSSKSYQYFHCGRVGRRLAHNVEREASGRTSERAPRLEAGIPPQRTASGLGPGRGKRSGNGRDVDKTRPCSSAGLTCFG